MPAYKTFVKFQNLFFQICIFIQSGTLINTEARAFTIAKNTYCYHHLISPIVLYPFTGKFSLKYCSIFKIMEASVFLLNIKRIQSILYSRLNSLKSTSSLINAAQVFLGKCFKSYFAVLKLHPNTIPSVPIMSLIPIFSHCVQELWVVNQDIEEFKFSTRSLKACISIHKNRQVIRSPLPSDSNY